MVKQDEMAVYVGINGALEILMYKIAIVFCSTYDIIRTF